MQETSASLLDRLRLKPDEPSWKRLVELYRPLIYGWLRRHGLQDQDAEDLAQEVMTGVVRELPHFKYDRSRGQFRGWLRTIMMNRLRMFWRSRKTKPTASGDSEFAQMLDQLADPNSGLSRLWNQEHDQHVARRLLEMIESEFDAPTWQAFRGVMLENEPVAAVTKRLGVTANAVYIAKYRVLRRLRQEIDGLSDA